MIRREDLLKQHSHPVKVGLAEPVLKEYLSALEGWILQDDRLVRSFEFKNFYQTIAFVNAATYVIHQEDHHPEMLVTYNRCTIKFYTHSVNDGRGGISENDFICAAKISSLVGQELH
ncbi:4a-hydroxytetrahydrobiopterin dehydratase [Bdellovibrio sp. HCB337]|uniref:4a-hydroxytetrahydrobiopterin dehydratase n=1 Tax=Bdellovibrio sp. HCB337 TaxID=3394358 RepID=UPI0039A5BD69